MHKNIQYRLIKIKYLLFFTLISQLYSLPYQEEFQIGQGVLKESYSIKNTIFKEIDIKTKHTIQTVEKKIVKINSLEQLLDELEIEKTFSIFKSKRIKKILNNSQINSYTHTFLIDLKVTNFQNLLQQKYQSKIEIDKNFKDKYGDHYIISHDIGGEYIALIHIKTDSANDYKKIEKIFDKNLLNWKHIEEFEKRLQKVSQTHNITFKNIITKNHDILPATDIAELIQNAKSFAKDIKNRGIPYRVDTKSYTKNIETTKIEFIEKYLKSKQIVNNLEFIRRNPEQFTDESNLTLLTNLKKFTKKAEKNFENMQTNNISLKFKYPDRYYAQIPNKPIIIESLTLPSEKITKKYPKISDKITFTLNYKFTLTIRNRGKVVLLDWTKTLKDGTTIVHKEKNSKILLDSYINYKDLKAINLTNNYGSITFKTKFDSYEKSKQLTGDGIIKSANCEYKVLNRDGELKIECKDIEFNGLNIKFKHKVSQLLDR